MKPYILWILAKIGSFLDLGTFPKKNFQSRLKPPLIKGGFKMTELETVLLPDFMPKRPFYFWPVLGGNRVLFFFRQFHQKLTIKMTVFCAVSVSKLNFWVVSWNRDLAKMLKLSVRPEKIETAGRGEAACRQFQFFSGRIWQFQHFMPIWRFHETCPKISTLTLKLSQKLSCLCVSFKWNCATIK